MANILYVYHVRSTGETDRRVIDTSTGQNVDEKVVRDLETKLSRAESDKAQTGAVQLARVAEQVRGHQLASPVAAPGSR